MGHNRILRAVLAALAGLLGLVVAATTPAPVAQIALVGMGAALTILVAALLTGPAPAAPPAPAPPEPEKAPEPMLPTPSTLIQAFDEPLLIVQGRRVVLANSAARALLGDHVEGVDVRLAIRHPAAAERLIGSSSADPADAELRIELVGLGDAERRWEMTTAALGKDSKLVRLIDGSAIQVAEQIRADFVANASHELRTPLATLLGFLETLQDDEADPARRQRFVKIMFAEATRMRTLVEDLISLSRIEAERYAVPRDPVDLVPLIEEVSESLRPLVEERGAALKVENEAGQTVIAGDRMQIAQLLHNLIANALRYGRAGTPVRIRLDDAGPELLRLAVIDQGEGIAAEHLPRLTERFYRVDAGRSRSLGGTGLGLAIVKHIVGRHRGRLDIRSTVGDGTSVRVYLPRAQASEPAPLS